MDKHRGEIRTKQNKDRVERSSFLFLSKTRNSFLVTLLAYLRRGAFELEIVLGGAKRKLKIVSKIFRDRKLKINMINV